VLEIPFCELVVGQPELARILADPGLSWRANRVSRHKRRAGKEPWFWPLCLLPDAILELKHPAEHDLHHTRRFAAAHHLLACIVEPRRRFSTYLKQLGLKDYPFLVAALSVLHSKSRQLDHPRVPDRQLRDLSDVECHVAELLWALTRRAYQELATQLSQHKVALFCEHCGALSSSLERKYCSDRCMKAAERRRRHLRNTPPEA
jgi:hypothetical protein